MELQTRHTTLRKTTMEKVNSETEMQTPNTPHSGQEKNTTNSIRRGWLFYIALLLIPVFTILACNAISNFYNTHIDTWAYHERFYVEIQSQDPIPSQILYEEARKYLPANAILVSAKINQSPNRSAHFKFKVNGLYNQSIFLNPYTGEVLGVLGDHQSNLRFWIGTIMYWLALLATCWLALWSAIKIDRYRYS
ncbi:PepSY domain-containing protein [Advenella sp. RU8]|uniref:PepSY domain-containing protein n=1 Tax=Advenella sp. RU8 TaxID=3399575 RepID=UPI003AAAC74E